MEPNVTSSLKCPDAPIRRRSTDRGFTLIETLFATGIILTALGAVAAIFAYSARTNLLTEQRTTATLLATSKMEELRSTSSISSLTIGGEIDLTDLSGVGGMDTAFFDYVSITTTGAILTSDDDTSYPYLTFWEISGTNPRTIAVSVWAQRSGITDSGTELIRTTTNLTNGF